MRSLIVSLIVVLLAILSIIPVPSGRTQFQDSVPQPENPESIRLETLDASFQDKPGDLRRFFEMDDPRAAAKELRDHLERQSISLDSTEPPQATSHIYTEQKSSASQTTQPLVHVFNGAEFVPQPGVEETLAKRASQLKAQGQSEQRIVCILQTQGEMTMGNVLELLDADVKVYEPVGRRALIVRLPISSLKLLTSRPYIRWMGEYKSEYKYAPVPPQSSKPWAFVYTLGGDRPEYRADLARLGVTVRSYDASARFYEVVLEFSRFRELAESLWWVKGIDKEPEQTLHELNYDPDDSRELVGAFITPFVGAGTRIGVLDTGIWPGNNLDFPAGSFTSLNGWSDSVGHGTHVSGIIAARGGRDIEGFYDAKGVAPAANIYMVSGIGASSGGYSVSQAFQFFSDNQVQISNHSWGFCKPGMPGCIDDYSYDNRTAEIDGYADNRDLAIVFSAGNSSDANTIGNPGTGKNVITVGAVNYVSAGGEEIGRRAPYSSQGPTSEDTRLKPDLVAPGGGDSFEQGIVSTISNPWNFGASLHGNVDGTYTYPEWPSNDFYLRLSGTSMAAPHVTGVCAKMKEWKPDFNSELLKALLINTTIPIKDNSTDALAGYATTQVGYGLVDALSVTSFYPGESERLLFGEGYVTENSLTQDWQITVPSGAQKLIVTFAYNDEEGESSNGAAIKDDLDLYLISPGGVEYVAYQHKATGVVGESPLEKMVIVNPSSGTWTARIKFFSSPGFGDPFVFAEQVYGLVAHAIYKTPALSLSVPQTTINVSPGQTFTVQPTITNTGGYIAAGVTVQIDGSSAFGGEINQSMYVGNLPYQNAAASPSINIVAPSAPGTYTLTIKADGINKGFDDSSYPKTAQITVTVNPTCNPPGAFSLSTPSNGQSLSSTTSVNLTWGGSANANSYDVYFGTSTNPPFLANQTGTSRSVPITAGQSYYWKVVAKVNCGSSTYTAGVWTFSVQTSCNAPGAFSLSSPSNGQSLPSSTTSINLSWGGSANANSYDVYFGTNSNPPFLGNQPGTSRTINVVPGQTYWWKVVAKVTCSSATSTTAIRSFSVAQSSTGLRAAYVLRGDFDGDGKADLAVWRPSSGVWFIKKSTGSQRVQTWGTAGDIPVPADYDGDGQTDLAVYRPSGGLWYVFNSANGSTRIQSWGLADDVPVPGDYDGDGKADVVVWRPSSGLWFILKSTNGSGSVKGWGTVGDVPVPGDYDGDLKSDIAVWRPSSGQWFIINSSNGSQRIQSWGAAGDLPVGGDFDGDGKADLAVFRPLTGVWYIINSMNNSHRTQSWGTNGDVPVASDYDGDAKRDLAVWAPSSGTWYIINSMNNSQRIQGWGMLGDLPVTGGLIIR